MRFPLFRSLALLFVVAVVVNYPWELGQSFLFVGWRAWENIWWHCFIASFGDGIILWSIFGIGWIVLGRSDWFIEPGRKGYAVMLAAGLIIAILIEWYAVHVLQRWVYTDSMPVLPGVEIGVAPLLQMLILPPLIFRIVAAFAGGRSRE